MYKLLRFSLLLVTAFCSDVNFRKPLYQFQYENAASNVPVNGYRVLQGGYYPVEIGGVGAAGFIGGNGGYSGQYLGGKVAPVAPIATGYIGGKLAPIEAVPISSLGYGGPLNGGVGYVGGLAGPGIGYGGAGLIGANGAGIGLGGHLGYGGESIEKEDFSGGKKNVNDERFEKGLGKKEEEVNYGDSGFSNGQVTVKDVKGDSGYYSNVDGGKKVYEDGKQYYGGQHFDKEGKNGEEKTLKQGHKKGHKIKSFKNSHHKDETGKTEEYYDEAHDEGGNYAFNGQSGTFGENGASSFKGGNQEGKYNAAENKQEGHFSNEHSVDKVDANEGKYGGKKFAGNQATFGYKNGADEQSLLGHQESSKFYKHSPFTIPFHRY